jgi:hypothetical protein
VKQWLCFLGTAQPQCIDTSILGTIRIHITLASNSVLRVHQFSGADLSYEIKNNNFTVDTISLNDGVYYSILNERLSNPENPISIPYQTWTHFSKGSGDLDGQTQATLSTESLDMLVGTVQQSNWASQNDNTTLLAPAFFSTGSSNITRSGFTINNIPYPPFDQAPHFNIWTNAFESTLQAFNLSQDVLGGTDAGLSNLTGFRNNYFMHAIRLNHPTASDDRVKCGMNLLGTNASITFRTVGNEANVVQHLWAGHTSVLQVKPYKQLQVIN